MNIISKFYFRRRERRKRRREAFSRNFDFLHSSTLYFSWLQDVVRLPALLPVADGFSERFSMRAEWRAIC